MLSQGQPVYPTGDRPAPETPDPAPAEVSASPDPDPSGFQLEIDGKVYTEAEVKNLLSRESNMNADYTQKMQGIADQKRSLEAEREQMQAQFEADKEALLEEARTTQDPYATQDESQQHLSQLERRLTQRMEKLQGAFEKDQADRQRAIAAVEADAELEDAVDQFRNHPFANIDEMRNFMKTQGFKPHQAQLAYNALYAGKVGLNMGQQMAVARGASVQPPMGAAPTSISPGISHPSEMPNVENVDLRETNWRQISKMAQEDPEIP
jgi:septal ring factor EnvC (AmiA/AmiB activator)